MTITHSGFAVYHQTEVSAKGALLGALFGGPRTSALNLIPDEKGDSYNDTVEIHASYGSYAVKGPDINTSSVCSRNELRWYYSGGKERI